MTQPPFPPPSARPEQELLLGVARSAVDPDRADADLAAVEWDAFLVLAERNRLLPLAHRFLSDRPEVPQAVRARLSAFAAANARQALAASAELRRLTAAMEGAGIRAIAYKGPALAVRAYGQLALRTYSDLDLLVAPEEVPAAARVLEGCGYRSAHAFSPAQDAAFRRTDGDYPYHHPHTGALVELHCRVSSARFCVPLPTGELAARARPVPVGGGEVPAPADDDLFLALCLHGAKHRWARLEWLAAAAALAVRQRLDLAALLARATAIGARRTVLLALRLMHGALGVALPPSVLASTEADPLPPLAQEARALWFVVKVVDEEHATAANLRYNYLLRDTAADRARYAARWLFAPSPEDWGWVRLPDALAPLYRVLRPLRLAARYGVRR